MARQLVAKFLVCLFIVLGTGCTNEGQLNESDLHGYFEAWSANDADKLMTYFGENILYEDVMTGESSTGHEKVLVFVQKFLADNPGVKLTPNNIAITNSDATTEWTMSAGAGDEAWSVRGVSIMEHNNGKIIRVTDYWDD